MERIETFEALAALPVIHGFTRRSPGLDVKTDRESALARLDADHAKARESLGLGARRFVTARQVHGREVAVVSDSGPDCVPDVDGLITSRSAVCLGIYVADCCPIYLVDPVRRVIGLLHSGRKGSELGIAAVAIERMRTEFGCKPEEMVVQLGPCIRPPCYEVDFVSWIIDQCRSAGVRQIFDSKICTACHLETYYSYRAEKGKTGRMLALLALA